MSESIERERSTTGPRRAYVDVLELLLERLRGSWYPPGSRLPAERALADELGVSRPTVREALAALELMGVVDTHVGAGTYVREPAGDGPIAGGETEFGASPSEVLQVRLMLEPSTARLAAANWDRQSLGAIARPLRNLQRLAEAQSSTHPTKEDRQFHTAIARATHNTMLIGLLGPLWEAMSESLWRALKSRGWTAAHTAGVAREHAEIYEAIRSRDGDLASFQMEKHIRGVIASLYESGDGDRSPRG
jgi:GntR family transcriptional regulator, uxu operon transcriptional repressor